MNDLHNTVKHLIRDVVGAQPFTDYALFVDELPDGLRVQMLVKLDHYTTYLDVQKYIGRGRTALFQATRYELSGYTLTLDGIHTTDVQYIGDSQHVASLTWHLRSNE